MLVFLDFMFFLVIPRYKFHSYVIIGIIGDILVNVKLNVVKSNSRPQNFS